MDQDSVIAAIKGGMKCELDSVSIYEEAAAKSEGEVQDFFLDRATEEKRHFNWLLDLHKELLGGRMPAGDPAGEALVADVMSPIPSEAFLKRVGSSRQLSAAISAAILLEVEAVRYYRVKAEECGVKVLATIFTSLARAEGDDAVVSPEVDLDASLRAVHEEAVPVQAEGTPNEGEGIDRSKRRGKDVAGIAKSRAHGDTMGEGLPWVKPRLLPSPARSRHGKGGQ